MAAGTSLLGKRCRTEFRPRKPGDAVLTVSFLRQFEFGIES